MHELKASLDRARAGLWFRIGFFLICAAPRADLEAAFPAEPLSHQLECAPMHVVLDVFSGRENPAWDVDATQAAEFSRLFTLLVSSDPGKHSPDTLGYRGFRVTCFQQYDWITVYHENIETLRRGRHLHWIDRKRTLEQFLLRSAREHIDPALYRAITMRAVGQRPQPCR